MERDSVLTRIRPGESLPGIQSFKIATHTKGASTGKKAMRPNLRLVPKGKFERLTTVAQLVGRLFG